MICGMISESEKERLARAMCKAERPIVNPDRVVENWLPEHGQDGGITRLVYGPIREWHTRLPLVAAILSEQQAMGYTLTKRKDTAA